MKWLSTKKQPSWPGQTLQRFSLASGTTSLGPGSVDDFAVTPVLKEGTSNHSGPGNIEESHTPSTPRCPSRSSNITSAGSNAGQFLAAFAEIQAASQQRQIEHDQKMQQGSAAFQQWIEKDCIKFETQLATILQQQNNQFQMNLMQENQLFQAELLKNLFEKENDGLLKTVLII